MSPMYDKHKLEINTYGEGWYDNRQPSSRRLDHERPGDDRRLVRNAQPSPARSSVLRMQQRSYPGRPF